MPPQEPSTPPDPYNTLPQPDEANSFPVSSEAPISEQSAQTEYYQDSQTYVSSQYQPVDQSPAVASLGQPDEAAGTPRLVQETHDFIAPQLDTGTEDTSYRRRLILWWGMRVVMVLLVIGLLGGGGYGIYRAVEGGKKDTTSSQQGVNEVSGDGSRAPLSEWECAKDETTDPNNESMCLGAQDAVIPIEKVYSCLEGFTKVGSGETTICEKPGAGAKTVTEALRVSYGCSAGYKKDSSQTACTRPVTANPSIQNTCPAGYSASGAQCVKSVTVYAAYTTACPSGWTKNATNCTKAAGVLYSCPSGYQKSGTKCTDTIALKADGTCRAGYKKTSGKCVKTITATISCPAGGYVRVGTTTTCRATTALAYNCPSGYVKSGTSTATKCAKTTVATAAYIQQRVCPGGYSLSNTTCEKLETKAANKLYSCSEAYTYANNQCQQVIGGEKETQDPTVEDGCREGYALTDSELECRRKDSQAHEGKLIQSCDDGWELKKTSSGARCYEKES